MVVVWSVKQKLGEPHVTGSNFNKYPAACKLAELVGWTHKQLKRISFCEAADLFFCTNQGKYPTQVN